MSDTPRKYRVVGETRFMGHYPGDEFEADFTDNQEARYIERGSIELADGRMNPASVEGAEEFAGEQSSLDEHFDGADNEPDPDDIGGGEE